MIRSSFQPDRGSMRLSRLWFAHGSGAASKETYCSACQPIDERAKLGSGRIDDEIDVERRAGDAVVRRSEGARQHEWNTGGVQRVGDAAQHRRAGHRE